MRFVEKWDFLKEKGWTKVIKGYGIFEQIAGWIKEPSMEMHSTKEAYERETTCQGQE